MTPSEFRAYAIHSAEVYYQYLTENGKGVVSFPVLTIQPDGDYFLLTLKTHLPPVAALDDLQFDWGGKRYTAFEIWPLHYEKETNRLTVRPSDELWAAFSALHPDNLVVQSDLRFLVMRVKSWYERYGEPMSLPSIPPSVVPPSDYYGGIPSEEQKAAVNGVLSHAFSYVWGAPGTGKTSFVLANSVLAYLENAQKEAKILLLAPTNQALEQMLYGLLPALEQHHFGLSIVLRLGVPSSKFYTRYPDVCEFYDIENVLADLRQEEATLEKCLRYHAFLEQFSDVSMKLPSAVEAVTSLVDTIWQTAEQQQAAERASAATHGRLVLCQDEINRHLSDIAERKKQMEQSPLFRVKQVFLPALCQKQLALLQEEEATLRGRLEEADALTLDFSNQTASIAACAAAHQQAEACLAAQRTAIFEMTAFWSTLQQQVAQIEANQNCLSQLQAILVESGHILDEKGIPYQHYHGWSAEQLAREIAACQAKISEIESSGTERRLSKVHVVAATIDRFLATGSPKGFGNFSPHHVFVDEAGYCALIKSVPLFSLGVPISLMGDHMQLPPICEMDVPPAKENGDEAVFLWAQSALYSESVLKDTASELFKAYLHAEPPPFCAMRKYDLTATYRFGSALAKVLASYVYAPGFHSALSSGTELYYLHAAKKPGVRTRTGESEARAISDFLAQCPLSDYAILTPYRNQAALISAACPVARKENRVFTVHASQGREWDVLFFSVVDTSDKWFTDTQRSETNGKMIVNTAVSRARKALILVCDHSYWVEQPNQLIGRLLLSAKPAPTHLFTPGGERL